MRIAFADQMADLGQLICMLSNPAGAEPPGQFRDQIEITDLSQRPAPGAVGRAEDGLESTLGGSWKRLRPERLPRCHRTQTDADAVGQFALGEMQPAALQTQIIPRHHVNEGTAATVGSECLATDWRRYSIRVRRAEQTHESARPCLTDSAIRRIVVATSRPRASALGPLAVCGERWYRPQRSAIGVLWSILCLAAGGRCSAWGVPSTTRATRLSARKAAPGPKPEGRCGTGGRIRTCELWVMSRPLGGSARRTSARNGGDDVAK